MTPGLSVNVSLAFLCVGFPPAISPIVDSELDDICCDTIIYAAHGSVNFNYQDRFEDWKIPLLWASAVGSRWEVFRRSNLCRLQAQLCQPLSLELSIVSTAPHCYSSKLQIWTIWVTQSRLSSREVQSFVPEQENTLVAQAY